MLPDELIHPWFSNCAVSIAIHINSVSLSRRASVHIHAKPWVGASRCRPHDEMKIPGVKVVSDATTGLIQKECLFPYGPIARKGPIVETQVFGSSIDARFVGCCTRCKIFH